MLLAIEQGNTNTLFAVHDGNEWIRQFRAATDATRTADEYAVWLVQLLARVSGQWLERGVALSAQPHAALAWADRPTASQTRTGR